FSILAALGWIATFSEMVTDIKYEWWHWLQPSLWGGLAVVLALRRLSLPALRAWELIGFGNIAAVWAYFTIVASNSDLLRRQVGEEFAVTFASYTVSLMWFSLMAIYAAAVPNTWRRAALVIGGMAATPFVVVVCNWWSDAPPVRVQVEFLLCLS